MTKTDYGIFTTIAEMDEERLLKMLHIFLKKMYGSKRVSATKSYIIAEGTIPICLTAHMDTVFSSPPSEIYYDQKKEVMWSPQGLGADDRAGVFAIMKIIQEGYRPHVIFTTGEERGGIGASMLIKVFPKAPFELKYMIELDRQGISDCVFYDCANNDFEAYVNKFGYVTAWGTFSDIGIFCPKWGVAGVNLSVGYIREHSVSEILYWKGLCSTIERVKDMLKDAANIEQFKYIPDPSTYWYYPGMYSFMTGQGYGPEDDFPSEDDFRTPHKLSCWGCGQLYEQNDLIPVSSRINPLYDHLYCYNCISNPDVGWCEKCGDAFEKTADDQKLCPLCAKYGDYK